MKFYNRQSELSILEGAHQTMNEQARMIVVTGRRRIGKTLLALKFAEGKPHLYLFVSKKTEALLCQEHIKQIKQQFDTPIIGEITHFKDVFALLLEISKKSPLVLIIDEFQEFLNINPSILSDIQKLWDLHKFQSQIEALFLGSVYSLMHKIFEDAKEPLFGRADRILHLRPFPIRELHHVLKDHGHPEIQLLFDYYMLTGGVPKYLDLLLAQSAFSFRAMIDFILSVDSPFLEEGKHVLIEEFGKEYGTYFSILELISAGKTSRSEIESILQKDIGGYLERLEKNYAVIKKHKPIHAKPESKLLKYQIKDHFLKFWFRFIYRNRTAVETGNFAYIKRLLEQHLPSYRGKMLEQFFYDLLVSSHQYNLIGSYWERGHTNEIDLVAINELDKKILIAEVKQNKGKIHLNKLKNKATKLLSHYKDYDATFVPFSLENARQFL